MRLPISIIPAQKQLTIWRFESQTVRVKSEIESRLDTYIALLRAGRSYFYATDTINKEDFRQFVANLNLRQNYPGVLAIGFSKSFCSCRKRILYQENEAKDLRILT